MRKIQAELSRNAAGAASFWLSVIGDGVSSSAPSPDHLDSISHWWMSAEVGHEPDFRIYEPEMLPRKLRFNRRGNEVPQIASAGLHWFGNTGWVVTVDREFRPGRSSNAGRLCERNVGSFPSKRARPRVATPPESFYFALGQRKDCDALQLALLFVAAMLPRP